MIHAYLGDALFDGRRFRALTVVDNFTKESLAIEVDGQLKGENVVAVMERLKHQRGLQQRIQTDNGSEFISLALDRWAYDHQVTLDYSRPGKPTDNPFIESFNGSFRDELLNTHWLSAAPMTPGRRSKAGDRITITSGRTSRSETSRPASSRPDSLPSQRPNFPVQAGPDEGEDVARPNSPVLLGLNAGKRSQCARRGRQN